MGFLVSPGVEVKEADLTNSIPAVSTSVGAYAGRFPWGPVGEIATVASEKELADTFGTPTSNTDEDYARSFYTAASFLRYGNALRVSRAISSDALNASDEYGGPTLITNDNELQSANFGVFGRFPGSLANGLSVLIVTSDNYDSLNLPGTPRAVNAILSFEPGTSDFATSFDLDLNDEVSVIVIDSEGKFSGTPGGILEIFEGLSLGTNAKTPNGASNFIDNVLNRSSRYIIVNGLDRLVTGDSTSRIINSETQPFNPIGSMVYTLAGGIDGNIDNGDIETALELFENSETVDINFIFADDSFSDINNVKAVANSIISLAEKRRDVIAFVSPPYSVVDSGTDSQKTAAVKSFFNDGISASTYAMFGSSPVQMYNRYADRFIWVSCAGHLAGLCANTDLISEPWFSPAGFTRGGLRNIVRTAFSPNQVQRDDLYKVGINPIVTFPGQGIVLYGDKTGTQRPSAFSRINVRRLFITLQKAIAEFSKFQLFELNDDFTRSSFLAAVEPYLRGVQGRRGISDFRVICDTTNNTQDVIDSNRFVADIYIKPERSINFITLNFVATRTGVEFAEIIGE